MKENYHESVPLRCDTCGGEDFESNEDQSYVKCNLCGREYFGGYDELVEFNQENINKSVEKLKNNIEKNLHKEISDMIENACKGKKSIKFK